MILHAAYSTDAVFRAVDFTGHAGRDCGEHRSTGPRARCRDCGEWCSPTEPCDGCERPRIRARVAALEVENAALRRVIFNCSTCDFPALDAGEAES